MTGRKLGNYEVLDKLGEGGMGQVWRARDSRLNRSVAVKVLPPDVAGDPARRQRFEQEARALGALNHPNIVAVYDVGQSEGQAYIVSELVVGESLRAILDRGPVPGRKLVEFAVQMADAIAAAHALGIVHRDLKPENVMVTRDDRVKVLDFGLAKQNAPAPGEDTATMVLSQAGMVLGTVGYMSPEQVRGEPVDARSDIFSFGCVLYEMAAGKGAFDGQSAADVMSAILKEEPPEITAARASATGGIPPALDAIVRRCLEKDPARRFQSAADLAFALRSITNVTATASLPPIAPVKRPRTWLAPAALALAAVLLFGAGYWLRGPSGGAASPEFHRLTFREGRVSSARFSPDWRDVIYSDNWDGGPTHIYLPNPGNPESRDLDVPQAQLLSVSSKGDLAFLVGPFFPDGSGTLARNSITGGQTRELLEHVRLADWSPDGSEMAIVRQVDGKGRLEYPVGKVLTASIWGPFGIRVSPDGQQVAFTTYDQGSSIAIYVVNRSGKTRKLGVVSGQTEGAIAPSLCWTRDGREIWFRSFDANDANTIYAIGLDGKRRLVGRFPGTVALWDVAADGRILFTSDTGRMGVRGLPPGETGERDLSCLETSELKGISDDGRIILANVLGESGGEKGSIYLRHTDGSAPIRLGDGVAQALSQDGKSLAGYSSKASDVRKFILMPTGAGETIDVKIPGFKGVVVGWLSGEENYLVGGWPNGEKDWRYFTWDARAQKVQPVTPTVADEKPFVSPDRKRVLAEAADHEWYAFAVDGGAPQRLSTLTPHELPLGWRSDNRSIYVMTHHDQNNFFRISLFDLETGKRTSWKEIRPAMPVDQVSNLQITPDGRAYAYNYTFVKSQLFVASGIR